MIDDEEIRECIGSIGRIEDLVSSLEAQLEDLQDDLRAELQAIQERKFWEEYNPPPEE